MIIYGLPICNFTNRVLICLNLKKIPYELVPPPGGYGSKEYKKIVPLGTIPALKHEGLILSESEVINEYLNDIYPNPNLLPLNLKKKAHVRMLCRFHDLKLEPIIRSFFPQMNPLNRNAEKIKSKFLEMKTSIKKLDNLIGQDEFFYGNSLTLADCAYIPSILLGIEIWDEFEQKFPLGYKLEKWMEKIKYIPEILKVIIPAKKATINWINSKKNQ